MMVRCDRRHPLSRMLQYFFRPRTHRFCCSCSWYCSESCSLPELSRSCAASIKSLFSASHCVQGRRTFGARRAGGTSAHGASHLLHLKCRGRRRDRHREAQRSNPSSRARTPPCSSERRVMTWHQNQPIKTQRSSDPKEKSGGRVRNLFPGQAAPPARPACPDRPPWTGCHGCRLLLRRATRRCAIDHITRCLALH